MEMAVSGEENHPMRYIAEVDGMEFPIEILDEHHVRFGNDVLEVDFTGVNGQPLYSMIVNGESFEGYVYPDDQKWQVLLLGRSYSVRVADAREKRFIDNEVSPLLPGKEFVLKSPMPGLVVLIPVVENQEVQELIISMQVGTSNNNPFPTINKIQSCFFDLLSCYPFPEVPIHLHLGFVIIDQRIHVPVNPV